ncbi:MAG: RND transporter [Gammaproteobacteria bacterium]|nr:RND transporter [Gammaproteobacteria bacterium]
MRWLEKIPLVPLILAAIFMGLAPFVPQPHLWEKLTMLVDGSLTKPVDIFDLLWHSALPILLVVKVVLARRQRVAGVK